MNENRDVPVYLFTGFLEAGKTKFIQETLEDKRFCNGERTLLLICEEGEEEYAPEQFADPNVVLAVVEDQADLNEENLKAWLHDSRAERVVVEYNGMWMLDLLYQAMPENWAVYQEFMFADATTFLSWPSTRSSAAPPAVRTSPMSTQTARWSTTISRTPCPST